MAVHWALQKTSVTIAEERTTEQIRYLSQPKDDGKYLGERRLQGRLSSLDQRDGQHFRTIETTWAEPSEHVPHQHSGLILGGRSPSPRWWGR